MSLYLLDLLERLDARVFRRVLIRGAAIATGVFCAFAVGGDLIFETVLQVRFAAFLIFGGFVFLLVGVRFVEKGPDALAHLRGNPAYLGGSIAVPFMIGPGTVSASVLAGARLPAPIAVLSVLAAMSLVVSCLLLFKRLHDYASSRNRSVVGDYMESVGRLAGLVTGAIAVEMILQGFDLWLGRSAG
jgi:small neutral amino acid transporter SnatA (MarC family)